MGMGKERPIMKDSPQGSTLYEFLGVRPIINGAGTRTAVGGSRMRPEVLDAMAEASRFFVDLMELNRAVGRYIAQLTGAEAGMVSAGNAFGAGSAHVLPPSLETRTRPFSPTVTARPPSTAPTENSACFRSTLR